jgi:hypothetical protein
MMRGCRSSAPLRDIKARTMDGRRPNCGRRSGIIASAFVTARIDPMIMPVQFPMRLLLLAFWFSLSFTATGSAAIMPVRSAPMAARMACPPCALTAVSARWR